ncbi:MAG TPA: hypothetical protein VLB84_20380 [Bacteroidia bacterium]|jgi:hypothetical protein|nr:hypothetical protein [Bacteroidia bacterium]
MIVFSKKYFFSTILIFLLFLFPLYACHKRGPGYNPYLHSNHLLKERQADKKANERAKKSYKKQMRKTRRHMFGKPAI